MRPMIPGIPISNEVLGTASLAVCAAGSVPYAISAVRGRTRPHVFTWFTWGLLNGIIFLAQGAGGAGPGRWAAAFGCVVSFIVAFLGLTRGERHITRSDWFAFLLAMAIIPLWYVTRNPLYAVLQATFIDALAYYPTFRKSWTKPDEESAKSYFIFALGWVVSLTATDTYNFTTTITGVSSALANSCLVAMLLSRRKALGISQ